MDGLNFNRCCNLNSQDSTWVSTAFIRDKALPNQYSDPLPDYLTNNPPATQVFIRVGPSKKNPSKLVFWINNIERPRLLLTKGKKYKFNVYTQGHPFYFTTDSSGGNGNVGNVNGVSPCDYYSDTFVMDSNVPKQFYYQCSNHPDMGGQVLII